MNTLQNQTGAPSDQEAIVSVLMDTAFGNDGLGWLADVTTAKLDYDTDLEVIGIGAAGSVDISHIASVVELLAERTRVPSRDEIVSALVAEALVDPRVGWLSDIDPAEGELEYSSQTQSIRITATDGRIDLGKLTSVITQLITDIHDA